MSIPLNLAQRFEKYVVSEKLITRGMKLVVAVSGGADSVAMLHLLHRYKLEYHLSLIAVHINHHLRDNDSDADVLFVKQLCDMLNINIVIKHIHLDSKADLENQARSMRRKILLQVLNSYKFDFIALAHQKNDQAETVLMNLSRGAGITGLGGIKPMSELYIRPLLAFTKKEIEQWLAENKFDWRHDKTNDDNQYTRNRIRNEIIPMMEQKLNQSLINRLYSQARIFQNTDDYLKKVTKRLVKKATIVETHNMIILNLQYVKQLAEIEQFYLLRQCYNKLCLTDHDFFMTSYEEIRHMYISNGSKYTKLHNNVWVIKQYDELVLTTENPVLKDNASSELVLDEERTHFVFMNWRFTLKYLKILPQKDEDANHQSSVLIDLNKVSLPLKIRSRMPGDRFIPTGMTNEKKLKDFFIDEKVPKLERDKVPILADNEKIVWIIGYRMDARTACSAESNRILQISIEPVTTARKRTANRAFNNKEGIYDLYEL